MAKLDDMLSSASSDTAMRQGLDPLRAAVFAELDAPPPRSWRQDVLLVVGMCWLLSVAIALALFATGQLDPAMLGQRSVQLITLLVTGGVCAFAALAPRRPGQQLVGFLAAAAGLVVVVALRGEGQLSPTAPWVCTLSHLAVGVGPLIFALSLLRKSALSPARAALTGLGVGTTGALLGELACGQSWEHVALWHVGAWVGLALVAAFASRRLVPRSFAP